MPKALPPSACPGVPVLRTVRRGTVLVRIHPVQFGPTTFNPTPAADPLRGGRFDSFDGSYPYLYAADTKEAAIAEVLVRDLPVDGPARLIPKIAVAGRLLTKIESTVDLQVVSLEGPDLGHVGQDSWLTKCDASDYEITRKWAAAIRGWVPSAAGFVWRSKRDERRLAYVFFEDRVPSRALVKTGRSQKLDVGRGLDLVRATLARHNAALSP